MSKVLRIRVGATYTYDELAEFFGGEDYIQGVDSPEIEIQLGERTINMVFVREDGGVYSKYKYKLVETNSWATYESER